MKESKAFEITVTGLVQGVGFRYSTKMKANALGLSGWVKNCNDGTVQLLISGDTHSVIQFIEWCQNGPDAARVDSLELTETHPCEDSDFLIIR